MARSTTEKTGSKRGGAASRGRTSPNARAKTAEKSPAKSLSKSPAKSSASRALVAKKPVARKPVSKALAANRKGVARGKATPAPTAGSLTKRVKRTVSKAVVDTEKAVVAAGTKTARATKEAAETTVQSIVSTGKKVMKAGRIVVQTAAGAASGAATGTVKAVKNAAHELSTPAPEVAKPRRGSRRKHTLGENVKSIATHAVAGAAVGAITGAMKVAIPELEEAAGIHREGTE
jgi:hypothetical protein